MVSDPKGKKHIWRGLGLLILGSALLLCTKFHPSPLWDSLLCFGGGGMLLYANGEFLFGLLIHANALDPDPSEKAQAPDTPILTRGATSAPVMGKTGQSPLEKTLTTE